jgi:argininosuccinate lyase
MTLYRGRIAADHSGLMDAINRSLPVDIRLLPYDLLTNRAWASELAEIGILTAAECEAILAALCEIGELDFTELPADEDVHTLTERLLTERVGAVGGKIHTGRSRNDQVVCDLRMGVSDAIIEILGALKGLMATLAALGEVHAATIFPGTTHLQPAQPLSLGHFLFSLVEALRRDMERLLDSLPRINQCPLGAGALAGSGFPVDRARVSEALGFDGPTANSIDAISDRDFVQEPAAALALLCIHLSRYAEQFVLWANPNFGYLRFADAWSTGSSMMPQKRNPDAMELVRGKAARCQGQVTTLFSLTKGLPLTYAKDLQEDKAAIFDVLDTALLCVRVFDGAVGTATFNADRMRGALTGDLLATDLADALTGQGVPFRQTHERVASLIGRLEEDGRSLTELRPDELREAFPELAERGFDLSFDAALDRRSVTGGTAPKRVREAAAAWRDFLDAIDLPDMRVGQ